MLFLRLRLAFRNKTPSNASGILACQTAVLKHIFIAPISRPAVVEIFLVPPLLNTMSSTHTQKKVSPSLSFNHVVAQYWKTPRPSASFIHILIARPYKCFPIPLKILTLKMTTVILAKALQNCQY